MFGRLEKSEFIRTICETFFATSLPSAIEIAQFASLSASVSFTPSPVIATVCPFAFRVLMIRTFCSGVTLPNIEYSSQIAASSSFVSSSQEMYLSASFIPTFLAIEETVAAWSPDMTFTVTP